MIAIIDDIKAGLYGGGEIEFTHRGIVRIFGRLEELEESTVSFAICILHERIQISGADTQRVLEMCQEQRAPLIRISTEAMPLSKEDAAALCRQRDEYYSLCEFLPAEYILWELGVVYNLIKNPQAEIYVVPLDEKDCVIVKVAINTYPQRTLTQLGKLEIDGKIFADRLYWENIASERATETFRMISEEQQYSVFSIMLEHLSSKHPGLRVRTPQLEILL
jgi:hypothetical protein